MRTRDELAEAQAALIQKRRALGIPERGVPPERAPDLPASASDSSPDAGPSFAELLQKSIAQARERKESREHEARPARDAARIHGEAEAPASGRAPAAKSSAQQVHEELLENLRGTHRGHARISAEMIKSPEFNSLTSFEHRVLCSLQLHCSASEGYLSRPGCKCVLADLGLSTDATNVKRYRRALAKLYAVGLVWPKVTGGPGRAGEYFIARNAKQISFIKGLNGRGHGKPPNEGA